MAFSLLVLKFFAFSEQQVMKDHCLSDVVEVEEEEGTQKKTNKTNNKPKKKKTKKILVFSLEQEEKVERFCVFALSYYIPMFFTSTWGCDAPNNDLRLYKELLVFKNIDDTLTTAALDRHHWYLAPPVVMFSLFSKKVSDDTKARVAAKLLTLKKPEARLDLPEYPTVTAALGLCPATVLGLLHNPQDRG